MYVHQCFVIYRTINAIIIADVNPLRHSSTSSSFRYHKEKGKNETIKE